MNSNHRTMTAPHTYARIAGFLYLTIILAGIFAQFFVRSQPDCARRCCSNRQCHCGF